MDSFAGTDFLGPLRTRPVGVYIWKHHDCRMSDYNYTEFLALTAIRNAKLLKRNAIALSTAKHVAHAYLRRM